MITSKVKIEVLICILLFLWPFVYLYKHTLPNTSITLGIGNDYQILYFNYKVYLLSSLSSFHFPLWSPAEGAGFPFFSSPFTQAFYPLNLFLLVFYKLLRGISLFDYQLFTISGLGIFAVGTYLWLRKLHFDRSICIISAGIFAISFKLTELLRFPNAIHTAAWIPWLLLGLTLAKNTRLSQKLIFVSLVMMVTAGYPYYLLYVCLLAGPYLLAVRYPLRHLIAPMFLATLLVGPYLLSVLKLMIQTVDRTGGNLFYSTKLVFTKTDTWGSLLMPPASMTEGWYYFGVPVLLIIICFLTYSFLVLRRNPLNVIKLTVFGGWFWLISELTYGNKSKIFVWLWEHLPFFSSLRVWPRLNVILVVGFSWLFAWAGDTFRSQILKSNTKLKLKVFIMTFLVYLFIVQFQHQILLNKSWSYYWTSYFTKSTFIFDEKQFMDVGILSMVILMFLLVFKFRRFYQTIILALLMGINVIHLGTVGSRQWSFPVGNYSAYYQRHRLDLPTLLTESMDNKREYRNTTISLSHNFGVGYVANWYYQRYISFLKNSNIYDKLNRDDLPEPARKLLGVDNGRRLFFTPNPDYSNLDDFNRESIEPQQLKILSYTGDKLSLTVRVTQKGYLSFIDNWDPDWKVYVDGQPKKLSLLFGTFKSVKISPENKLVEFVYRPNWL